MKHFGILLLAGMVVLLLVASLFAQWEPDVRLTYDDSTSHTSYTNAKCVAANGDTVHVVWDDNRDGNPEIYYKSSPDGGTSWGSDTRLTDDPAYSELASVAVFESNIHIVWRDMRDGNREIYYKRSTNGGSSWSTDVRLTNNTGISFSPSVSVSGNTVHVVWDDNRDGNYEIYYKSSPDGGTSWGSDTRLTDDPVNSRYASAAVSGTDVHVVWDDERDGNPEIYYKSSPDGGTSWGTDIRLTNQTADSEHPSVAVSGSTVHVVWDDNRDGNYEIYYKRSPDSGTSWGTDTRLTYNSEQSLYPSAVASESNVHVLWFDERDGNPEIYYKSSPNAGISWGTDTRLTNDPANSRYASAAVSSTNVHVVWFDERDGNPEIYYKRNPTGNAGIEEQTDPRSKTTDIRLVCYPNPFTSIVRVKYAEISEKQKTNLEIYDVRGRLVKSVQLTTSHLSLGTEFLPGIYFLKADSKYVGKVLKVR